MKNQTAKFFSINSHFAVKLLLKVLLIFVSFQVSASPPMPPHMGSSAPANLDKPFGSNGHPYLLFSDERVTELRNRLSAQEPGAIRFKNFADQVVSGKSLYAFGANLVAFMYPIVGEDKYCVDAVQKMDNFVAQEEAAIATYANGGDFKVLAAYDSFLYVGGRVGGVGAVFDWCYGFLSDSQKKRWIDYGNEVLFNLWYYKEASWGGRSKPGNGYATNNPLNNYYYSFLEATMYFGLATQGDNPKAQEWLTLFRETKVENQMLPKFGTISGGGSAEGTGYGTALARAFKVFDWWQGSSWLKADGTVLTGEKLYDRNVLAKDSLNYMLHSLAPTFKYLAPYGDHARDSRASIFDSHRDYILVLSSFYPTSNSARAAKTLMQNVGLSQMQKSYQAISDFLYSNEKTVNASMDVMPEFYYAETVGHVFSRTDWGSQASYFSASIGPYHEVHDHRDKNSFLFYKNDWLAYDQNINSKSGLLQKEIFHNMVRFDKLDTTDNYLGMIWFAPEPIVHAVEDTPVYTYVSADTAPLYEDRKTKVNLVEKYKRDMVYLKPDVLVVYDQIKTTAGNNIKKTWQLQSPYQPQYSTGSNTAFFQGGTSSMNVTTLIPEKPAYKKIDYLATGTGTAIENYYDSSGSVTSGHRLEIPLSGESVEFLNILDFDKSLASSTILSHDSNAIVINLIYSNGASQKVTISRCCGEVTIQ